jgi:hypothetical protein
MQSNPFRNTAQFAEHGERSNASVVAIHGIPAATIHPDREQQGQRRQRFGSVKASQFPDPACVLSSPHAEF